MWDNSPEPEQWDGCHRRAVPSHRFISGYSHWPWQCWAAGNDSHWEKGRASASAWGKHPASQGWGWPHSALHCDQCPGSIGCCCWWKAIPKPPPDYHSTSPREEGSEHIHHLQKHKNSMGCLQIENGLCQELSKAVVATGIIGLCQL